MTLKERNSWWKYFQTIFIVWFWGRVWRNVIIFMKKVVFADKLKGSQRHLYNTLYHCPDRGAPGCTGVHRGAPGFPRGHPDRNLSNHPHPNEILKRPCHPSGSPGCWSATPVADQGEPQWNLDSRVHTPTTISNSSRPGCTPMKFSLAGRLGWTPVEILLSGVHPGGIF